MIVNAAITNYLNNHQNTKNIYNMKKHWKSIEEYREVEETGSLLNKEPDPEFSIEGMEDHEVQGKSSRRDFLKMLGFTVGYAALATGCETPVRKAIPYLNQPNEITPGIANYYASTYFDGHDYCSVLVKTREGRPIKIEGNELSPISQGATSARVQASVLNLYDTARLQGPLKNGEPSTWPTVDSDIVTQFEDIAAENGKVVILTSTIISPSSKKVIKDFILKFPNTEWLTYDSVSMSAYRKANELTFGKPFIPSYSFENAKIIVSFNADFLGTWLSPVEFTKQYTKNRKVLDGKDSMSRHIQFETNMTLTGGKADKRYPIKPSEEGVILMNLYNEIASKSGKPVFSCPSSPVDVSALATELLDAQGESLVISGTNDLEIQKTVNAINDLLYNYCNTIHLSHPSNLKQGDDEAIAKLVNEMNAGEVNGLLVWNANPVYDYPEPQKFVSGLEKVSLLVSFSDVQDETAKLAHYVCPDNNYLESWNDAEPREGVYSLAQPTIPKLFNTRQVQETLLKWAGNRTDFLSYMETFWEENLFTEQTEFTSFKKFWNQTIHDGTFIKELPTEPAPMYSEVELKLNTATSSEGLELLPYEKVAIGTGKHANNPWLQEMPDPTSMATWDNYLCISPKFAEEEDLENEDVVKINDDIEIPVLVQPGQAYGTASIALGYGRTSAGKVADDLGLNVYPFLTINDGDKKLPGSRINISKTGKTYPLALTQTHNTMENRPLARETTLKEWKVDPAAGNEMHADAEEKHTSLYVQPQFKGFRWGMAINLNACVGCGNCVISCQAENNVSVIGKEQVKNRRIMHWMRLDRYYSGDLENPSIIHQPVMCQHCDNAPCENVCPVAATPHSDEGLNQMIYNRCIGTRYCMNNCPYRVRRFNWFQFQNNDEFDYNQNNELGKMQLNPDVTVRSRGVVEKCSLCVQRIQEKKLLAKTEDRPLEDGEIKTACQQSCPANAIVFGNLLDPESEIAKLVENPRNYQLLETIHTLPSISYLTRIKNEDEG